MRRLAKDPAPVLRAGLSQDIGQLGLIGKSIIHADTLWESLIAAEAGWNFLQFDTEITFRIRNGRCRISYNHTFGDHPEAAVDVQYTIGLLYNLISESKNARKADLHLWYPHASPEHSRVFPDAVHLKNGQQGFAEFNDTLLRSPMRRSDAYLSSIAKVTTSKFSATAMDMPTTSELVSQMQCAAIIHAHSTLSLADAAVLLDMPERSLQARLNSEKTSFAGIRQRVQHDMARRELLSGRSIEHTSNMLGFSQRQNFSEAFSRWEGTSPSEFASRKHKKTG